MQKKSNPKSESPPRPESTGGLPDEARATLLEIHLFLVDVARRAREERAQDAHQDWSWLPPEERP